MGKDTDRAQLEQSTSTLQQSPSTIASWIRFVAAGLEDQGVDTIALLRDAGINPEDFENPNKRIELSHTTRLWNLASERSNNPCLSLSIAETAQADIFSGLGLSIIFSGTIGEAIERFCRYSRVVSDSASLELITNCNKSLDLVYRLQQPAAAEAVETFMAAGYRILEQISHERLKPLEVHLCNNKVSYRDRYENFFRAPVVFNAPIYKFVLGAEALDLPCFQPNPELARNMEEWMSQYLAQFETSSLESQVRKLLLKRMTSGEIDQCKIASELAMSSRALQRGLKKDGFNFRQMANETRRDMAEKYLNQTSVSLTEICYLLGFSDQSNFTKSFKRWTGLTPGQYRQQSKRADPVGRIFAKQGN